MTAVNKGKFALKNIDDFPVQDKITVAWGEMDASNHVNNVVYYRYFENARIKYFHAVGLMEYRKKNGIFPVLAQSNCKYLKALTYPDHLIVGARVKSIGTSSFVQEYLIFSEKSGVAAFGEGVLVMYDFNNEKAVPVPE